ncbi:PREDICTED: uncharacterized protein LOC105969837 [Erythranthe guttata]|uniref:uncharacterized protein LOC105969837 n=1 Tax=Erythranthe guttata TaxID=4155 RepID=UPI00064DE1AB|nr:PREDICTED: uncharacterized protein LOC105969837 [Erythranthe guttata]|eukprot:XP_012850068.1 PREDICTED: uncharacterized protein LOC105969837 [Erythranthe guttata]
MCFIYFLAGRNNDYFTIVMHHSGKIMDLGKICYVGGKVSYFDYCCYDEMSMTEITEMARELKLEDWEDFYHSRSAIQDCSVLYLMENDNDALELVNYLDKDRATTIYVKHLQVIEDETEKSQPDSFDLDNLPYVDETVGYVGDVDEVDEFNDVSECDVPEFEVLGSNMYVNHMTDSFGDNDGLFDDNESGGSDVQSVGDDSEHSDFLVDSDFFASDDDFQYDNNVDHGVEWGGLRSDEEVEEPRRSMRLNKGKEKVAEDQIDETAKKDQWKHHNFPVFNPKIDMVDPNFQLGVCFNDAQSFRDAIRQHSIVNGRDIKLRLN